MMWRYLAIASISASGKDGCDRNSQEMTAATIVRLMTEMAVIETQPGHKMAVIETQPGGSDRERKTEGPSDPKAKLIINK